MKAERNLDNQALNGLLANKGLIAIETLTLYRENNAMGLLEDLKATY